jgi:hypothetical protein
MITGSGAIFVDVIVTWTIILLVKNFIQHRAAGPGR